MPTAENTHLLICKKGVFFKKKTKEKVEETVVIETRRVKESIEQIKEELWKLEENELRRLLDLQNCDETSVLESRILTSKDGREKVTNTCLSENRMIFH